MTKSIVFITHITEEAKIAQKVKESIESNFFGTVEVFLSSEQDSVSPHTKDKILDILGKCAVELILCSQKSLSSPWIYFGSGAGCVRKIPVILLCHSGMKPSLLPIPLNLLQALEVSNIESIFPVLDKVIGTKTPSKDFTKFVEVEKEPEIKYTFWDECNEYFGYLFNYDNQLIYMIKEALMEEKNIQLYLRKIEIEQFEVWMKNFFEKNNLLKLIRTKSVSITKSGNLYGYQMILGSKLKSVLLDERFKYKI